jgi:hypothetical protein
VARPANGTSPPKPAAPAAPARPPGPPPDIRPDGDGTVSGVTQDLLDYEDYATALVGVINQAEGAPFTLAINAAWGTGKSSLANLVKAQLLTVPGPGLRKPVTCDFNAWHHDEGDALSAAFVRKVAQAADHRRRRWRRLVQPLPLYLVDREDRLRHVGRVAMGLVQAALLACIAILAGLWALRAAGVASLQLPPGWLVGSSLAVGASVQWLWKAGTAVASYAKDPARETESGSLESVRRQLGRLVEQACPDGERFVVFVDDLERCRPPNAVDVLEVVSQLLIHPQVVVVLVADMSGVAANVSVKYATLADKYRPDDVVRVEADEGSQAYGRRFIQKIVQLQFDLPPLSQAALQDYLTDLSKPRGARNDARPQPVQGFDDASLKPPVEEPVEPEPAGQASPAAGAAEADATGSADGPARASIDPTPAAKDGPGKAAERASRLARALDGSLRAFLAANTSSKARDRSPNPGLAPTSRDGALEWVLMALGTGGFVSALYTIALWIQGKPWKAWLVASLVVYFGGFAAAGVARGLRESRQRSRDRRAQEASESRIRAEGLGAAPARSAPASEEEVRQKRIEQSAVFNVLGTTSADFTDAWTAGRRDLPGLPRSAKRYLNRVRLLLYLSWARGLGEGPQPVKPEHIGRWAALQERWPEVAHHLFQRPEFVLELEEAAERSPKAAGRAAEAPDGTDGARDGQDGGGPDKDPFRELMAEVAPMYARDERLRRFFQHPHRLGPVLRSLVFFDDAPDPADDEQDLEGADGREGADESGGQVTVAPVPLVPNRRSPSAQP